jgi:hypothetical protein
MKAKRRDCPTAGRSTRIHEVFALIQAWRHRWICIHSRLRSGMRCGINDITPSSSIGPLKDTQPYCLLKGNQLVQLLVCRFSGFAFSCSAFFPLLLATTTVSSVDPLDPPATG